MGACFRYSCIGFLIGVFCASVHFFFGTAIAVLVCVYIFLRSRRLAIFFLLSGAVLGILRFSLYEFPCAIDENLQKDIIFFGIANKFPDKRIDKILYTLKIFPDGTQVMISAPLAPAYAYGDLLKVQGIGIKAENSANLCAMFWSPKIKFIERGWGNFFLDFLFRIREFIGNRLEMVFNEPEASLAKGLVLGDKGGFTKEIVDDFRRSGLTHLTALSGYNITLVILFFTSIAQYLFFRFRFGFVILGIISFVLLTGASASVTRAAIMGLLFVLSKKIGRPYAGFQTLVFACFAMVFWNPRVLAYDIGFQLSALATLGLLLGSKYVTSLIARISEVYGLRDAFVFTIVAQVFTMPIILKSFGRISLVAPLSNILVTPIIPIAMFLILLAFVFGSIWLPLGQFFGFLPMLLMKWILTVASWFSL